MFLNRYKKFGGDKIPNVINYIKDYIELEPNCTISVGCDSIQKRRVTMYANTIGLYSEDLRKGAHVIFFRDTVKKIRDNQERLYLESKYLFDIGTYLDNELSSFYKRKDLTDFSIKKYKFHLNSCDGHYQNMELHNVESYINNMSLGGIDNIDYKLVDLHIDYNPFMGNIDKNGINKNKSYHAYKSYVPWLRSSGFRTWAKPDAWCATSAADLLLK